MRPTIFFFLLALTGVPVAGPAVADPTQHYSERYGFVQPHPRGVADRPRHWHVPPRRALLVVPYVVAPRPPVAPRGWYVPSPSAGPFRPPVVIVLPQPQPPGRWR